MPDVTGLCEGDRVRVEGVEDSPLEARTYGDLLVGRSGVVQSVRGDSWALVRLDQVIEVHGHSRRRWLFAQADLVLLDVLKPEPVPVVHSGVALHDGVRVVHALKHWPRTDQEWARTLCGVGARPLWVADWPLPFSAALKDACPACRKTLRRPTS
ncbi:hypothetical protein [Nonomuraea longicatena]|uniref:Uncharacterized protein n=1 Tax=Nonomuraea longicatena TaxID=83682 RepID=A0ABP3ZRZ1_9ACTN